MKGTDSQEAINERFVKLMGPVLDEKGFHLIGSGYTNESGNWFLRAFIARDDGEAVSINDCTMISRIVSKKLDKDDFIDDEYTLEVCSRGFMDDPHTEDG